MCDEALFKLYGLFQRQRGRDSVGQVKRVLAGLKASIRLRPLPCGIVEHQHTLLEGNTLLNFAARCGCIKVSKYLILSLQASLLTQDVGGFTPLLNAVWRNDRPMVSFLLSLPACDLSYLHHKGMSRAEGPFDALEWAQNRNHPQVEELLQQKKRRLLPSSTHLLSFFSDVSGRGRG